MNNRSLTKYFKYYILLLSVTSLYSMDKSENINNTDVQQQYLCDYLNMFIINGNNDGFIYAINSLNHQTNYLNKFGQTPLIIASKYNNLAIVRFLINRGALIDVKDNNNKSALNYAFENLKNGQSDNFEMNCEIIKLLSQNSAYMQYNTNSFSGEKTQSASLSNNKKVANSSSTKSKIGVNETSVKLMTSQQNANKHLQNMIVKGANNDFVKVVGLNINIYNSSYYNQFGETFLITACKSANIKLAHYLIVNKISLINTRDNTGKLALDYAQENSMLTIVDLLTKDNIELPQNLQNVESNTPSNEPNATNVEDSHINLTREDDDLPQQQSDISSIIVQDKAKTPSGLFRSRIINAKNLARKSISNKRIRDRYYNRKDKHNNTDSDSISTNLNDIDSHQIDIDNTQTSSDIINPQVNNLPLNQNIILQDQPASITSVTTTQPILLSQPNDQVIELDMSDYGQLDEAPKEYRCDICEYETLNKEELVKHIEEKHPKNDDLWDTLYECPNCDFETPDKSIIRAHIVAEHNK